jgi:hypothetical protein
LPEDGPKDTGEMRAEAIVRFVEKFEAKLPPAPATVQDEDTIPWTQ